MRAIKTTTISILTVGLLAGSAVAVAAQDDPMTPVAVTGTAAANTLESGGSPTMVEGFGMLREGRQIASTWEASDPRLSGDATMTGSSVAYSEQRMEIGSGEATLENDGGRWVGRASVLDGERLGATFTYILRGEDAYDGLTAYVVVQRVEGDPDGNQTLNAAIFPGEMPSFAEPSAAE